MEGNTVLPHRSDFRFGGVSLKGFESLPSGNGKLSASEYLPWDNPEFERDPNPWFERVLNEAPVLREESGTYVVSKYADIFEFGQLPSLSTEEGWDEAGPWSISSSTIIGRDGDDHSRMRRKLSPWLAPKANREWVITTGQVTERILDTHPNGELDGWLDLVLVATHETMCRILKVNNSDPVGVMHEIAMTMPMLSACPRAGAIEDAAIGFQKLSNRVDIFLADRQNNPSDGLMDALMALEQNGDFSHTEMRSTLLLLYALGHMDVGYFITAGLRVFAELPEVFSTYKQNVDLRDSIINEIVRFDTPEPNFYRTTTEDLSIRGVDIKAGSTIRFLLGAANKDPEIFEDPHTFKVDRPLDHKVMSFGTGIHTCPGQAYSRAQARVIYDILANRYSSISLREPFEMDNTDFSRHFLNLPLTLS